MSDQDTIDDLDALAHCATEACCYIRRRKGFTDKRAAVREMVEAGKLLDGVGDEIEDYLTGVERKEMGK